MESVCKTYRQKLKIDIRPHLNIFKFIISAVLYLIDYNYLCYINTVFIIIIPTQKCTNIYLGDISSAVSTPCLPCCRKLKLCHLGSLCTICNCNVFLSGDVNIIIVVQCCVAACIQRTCDACCSKHSTVAVQARSCAFYARTVALLTFLLP